MSHQISKTLLVTALSLTLVLLFHASISSAIDKKFQSQQISNQSTTIKKSFHQVSCNRLVIG